MAECPNGFLWYSALNMTLFSLKKVNGTSVFILRIGLGLIVTIGYVELIYKILLFRHFHLPYMAFPLLRVFATPSFKIALPLCLLGVALSLAFTVGYRIRYTGLGLTLLSSYLLLTHFDQYNNHYYLIILLIGLLSIIQSDNGLSVTKNNTDQLPEWQLKLLQFQIAIPYFFSGFQKLTDADWRAGLPFLQKITLLEQHSLLGPLFSTISPSLLAKIGISFDLSIAFLLWRRKTRGIACILLVIFHSLNHFILYGHLTHDNGAIGIFPILGILTLVVFIDEAMIQKLSHIGGRLNAITAQINRIGPQKKLAQSTSQNASIEISRPNTTLYTYRRQVLGTIGLGIIALYPIYQYWHPTQIQLENKRIGLWNNQSHHYIGAFNVYYRHTYSGQWVLFKISPEKWTTHNNVALRSREGQYHLLKAIKQEMESKGLFTTEVFVKSHVIINQHIHKKIDTLINWSTLSPKVLHDHEVISYE